MKLSELKKKLAKMTDEQIEDYLGDMQDRGKYEKIELDGPVLCSEDPVLGGAVFDEKTVTVSDGAGLGIKGIEEGRLLPV